MELTTLQEKGYMPAAILNWLALAGWGTTHGEIEEGKEKVAAPTSTEMFTLPELIEKVEVPALPRSIPLIPLFSLV